MAELELSFSFAKLASDHKVSADRLATVPLLGWFASPAPDFSFRLGTILAQRSRLLDRKRAIMFA